jgi:hypothetical protein
MNEKLKIPLHAEDFARYGCDIAGQRFFMIAKKAFEDLLGPVTAVTIDAQGDRQRDVQCRTISRHGRTPKTHPDAAADPYPT